MENKLRLIMTPICNRDCKGCCNNDFDINQLPIVPNFRDWDTIMVTGGEPMLYPEMLHSLVCQIKNVNKGARLILYTAKSKRPLDLIAMLHYFDEITLTLHEQLDVDPFADLNLYLMHMDLAEKSLRLNVFEEVHLPDMDLSHWKVKDNIKWIKNCPLPEGETLMRLF